MDTQIVIAGACRTAIGKLNGSLAGLAAGELGSVVIKAALERAGVEPAEVSQVIMGQVLTGGAKMNPARQAALGAGIPHAVPALTINQVCGSGLRSILLAAAAVRAGEAKLVVAGGQESMSNAPHALLGSRRGWALGNVKAVDTMIHDGLWDAFNDCHMGVTAENIAQDKGIDRQQQDEFAAASQAKAAAAIEAGRFADEIVAVQIEKKRGETQSFATDEFVRAGTSVEKLAGLRPAFAKDGSVTAGNASGINDGAAACLVMSADEATRRGIKPQALLAGSGLSGVDPRVMGLGPIPAARQALERAGWQPAELELIEANEAFAVQAIAVNREVGWNEQLVNVNGGAIALGHPIGASGCRVVATLLHEMARRDAKKALATLCIGGGMGIAACFARP
ncbi:MAG: acetyl-CoA C-acetyltransferase [Betaproteobacteria bacterium]|nr:acetyl-CoA C-acetyltransferase [Betaproteobacteria bacterium]